MATILPDPPTLAPPPPGSFLSPNNFNIQTMVANILGVTARVVGIIAFLMLLYGGFNYITSRGDPKNLESAQKTITGAFIGIVLIIFGWFLLQILERITGADLTCFSLKINTPCP